LNIANAKSRPIPVPGLRWWIAALLSSATILSYVDRGLVGFLKPDLQRDLHFNEIDYSHIVAAFSLAYAIGQLLSGRLIDLIGVRLGFVVTVACWSLAAMGHAIAGSLPGFETARFALGLAEGGNYPGASKAVGEWFPKKDRALGTGIFNAGSNLGALLTPIVVTFLTVRLGFNWRFCFLAAGLAGFLWLIPWLLLYRAPEHHPRLRESELAHICADRPAPSSHIAWPNLLRFRATWAFIVGLTLTSPIWWFYLYWFPDFLTKSFHLDKQQQQGPIALVYILAGVGSIGGGWLSSTLIRRGVSVSSGRKIAMVVCALCVVPVFFAPRVAGMWTATLLVGLAAGSHQGFASNLFTMVSDTQPPRAVRSVTGMGGFSASLMAMLFQDFSGHLLQSRQAAAYTILFGMCSCFYLVAVLCVHLLMRPNTAERQ
jgi:ACS family hexuronate transporter-like MFS transporter